MEKIIIVIIAGVVIGYLLRNKPKIIKKAEKLTVYIIYLLLFLMGISIGLNDQVISNFGKIGFQAAVISLASIAGSVLICWFLYTTLFKDFHPAAQPVQPEINNEK